MTAGYEPGTMTSRPVGPPVVVPHKVHAPAPTGLRRPRLENRVVEALRSGHVLIVGPPGAGKTTLLSQVAVASGLKVAWYAAGAEEADPAVLVHYLARALGRTADQSLQLGASVDALLAAIGERGPHVPPDVLVIDDLHELLGTPSAGALQRFVECCPGHLHLVLGTRRPPDFNVPRMLATGHLVQFDGDDLRFRSWEVEELFRELYQEPLSPESAALLTRRVGGFAAALQLFHLSIRGCTRADREAHVVQLSGRSPLIRSYLARTVLDSLSTDRREFLLRTSVLGVLDVTVCDALLGRTDSARMLHNLARDQVFTTTQDGVHHEYHQILRNHLAVTLEDERTAAEVIELHLRAARLLEEAGYPVAALRAYQRAGDYGSAGRLVRTTFPGASLAVCPVSAEPGSDADPWLSLARARGLLRRGSIEAGVAALDQLLRTVDDPDLTRLCGAERLAAAIWLPGAARLGDVAGVPLAALRALTQIPARDAWPGLTSNTAADRLLLVLSKIVLGEFASARAMLGDVRPSPADAPWIGLATRLIDIVVELTEPDGAALAAARLDDLSLTAEVEGYPWLGRLARGLQAGVLLEETGEACRSRTCEAVIEACVRDGDRWGELLLRIVMSVTFARLGWRREAQAGFAYAGRLCHELGAPMLDRWVQGYLIGLRVSKPGPNPSPELVAACERSLESRRPKSPQSHPTPPPRLGHLQCLGGFRLSRANVITELSPLRPRARLLLMRLAIQYGCDIHREHLIEALWPEAGLAAGLRRLQVAVSSVRHLLDDAGWGADCLPRLGDAYRLQLPDTDVDLQVLQTKVAEISRSRGGQVPRRGDEMAQASWIEYAGASLLDVYRGDLLPEVGSAEWVLPERDRLRLLTASSLAVLGRLGLEAGRPDLALAPAARLVELDPYRDTAWLLLARIQRSLGDHNAADVTLAAYHRIGAELRESGDR